MNNFNVCIENHSTKNSFHIKLLYEPYQTNKVNFSFGNSSKKLERSDLEFLDKDLNIIHPSGIRIITPTNREKITTQITKEVPFVYDIKGNITYTKNQVYIKLVSAEYVLTQGESYYVQLRYKGQVSEKVELKF